MKTKMKSTSLDAYFYIRNNGAILNQSGILFAYLKKTKPKTRNEISNATGIAINAVCGRINKMIKDGWLNEYERRPCKITNIAAHPVGVA